MRQEASPFGIDARPASAHERPRERSTGLFWSGEEKARPDSISKNKIAAQRRYICARDPAGSVQAVVRRTTESARR